MYDCSLGTGTGAHVHVVHECTFIYQSVHTVYVLHVQCSLVVTGSYIHIMYIHTYIHVHHV